MSETSYSIDFHRLFETVPGLYAVLNRDLKIVAVTDEYLRAMLVEREDLTGRYFFDVFPHDPDAARVRSSFEKVFATGEPDELPLVKYDISQPAGDGFTEKYRRLVTFPGFAADGQVSHIIHRVEDVTERKMTEDILRESEMRLKFTLAAGQLGSYEYYPLTGKMFSSERCLANFGLPPDADFSFEKFLSMIHSDDRSRVRKAIEKAIAERDDYKIEYKITRADGNQAWIYASGRCLYDNDGNPLVMNGVTLDITSRRQSEEDLRESQQRLALALQAGRAGTFEWDIKKNVNIWSPELEEMYGVPVGTFEGDFDSWAKRVVPEDAAQVVKSIEEALARKDDFFDYEFRAVLPDGTRRWFYGRARFEYDAESQPSKMTGINVDVTNFKKAQAEISERARMASMSGDIGIALNRREDLPQLLKYCTDALVEHLDVAFARIWTLDKSGETLVLEASSGIYTHLDGAHSRIRVGEYKIGKIAEERQPHLTNDVPNDPHISDKDWARSEQMTAFAGYPLVVEERLVGVMCAFSRRTLTETVLQAMSNVANSIANAIERKQTEANLQESDERFQLVTRATNDAIWDWNLQTNDVWWNRAVKTMFGFKSEQVGQTADWWYEHIHPEDRERVVSGIHAVIDNGGENWSDEYRFLCADGSYKYVFDRGLAVHRDGQPVRMLGAMQDVTERKNAEEALRLSQDRLELAIDASQLGLWYCDLPFDVLNWSDLTKEHFWLPADAVVTIDEFYRIIHPDDRERTRLAIEESIAKQTIYDVVYRTVNPDDDRVKYIRAIGRGFYDEKGAPYRFDGVTLDITENKLIESEREQLLWSEKTARAEAEQANRMKDEFLATLSHELRTPLSSILGWSRLLKDGKIPIEQTSRAIETIERNAKAQSQLIEDILDVSRITSGKLRLDVRPVELDNVIEMAIESVRPAAEAKNIRLQKIIDSNAIVSGDPDRLQQIIWNLLSNSIKFTPKDGRVRIKLERINSHVEITVEDNGIGIDAETLPYIFERFRQSDSSTTRKYGGLGLGLAIVRHLVELHGGSVDAKSDGIGKGAVFTVALPITVIQSKEMSFTKEIPSERIYPAGGGDVFIRCPEEVKNLRILVVDDEPDTRTMLEYIFTNCGAAVGSAASAEEALEIFKSNKFDILISDIGMPERDGYELIKQIRRLAPEHGGRIPAVALTAYARIEDRLRILSSGFQMHVTKPIEPAELLTVVASLANRDNHK